MVQGMAGGVSPQESLKPRTRTDKIILTVFLAFATVTAAATMATLALIENTSASEAVSVAIGGLALSFTLAGIPALIHYRRKGLVRWRRILLWATLASLASIIATAIGMVIANDYYPDLFEFPQLSAAEFAVVATSTTLALFVAFLLMILFVLVLSFGVVGVMCAAERRLTPWIMRRIIQGGGSGQLSLYDMTLKWLFDIPDVLDPRTLTINPSERRTCVRWQDLKVPVAWQMLFGIVLAIYVSFNPFFTDRSPSALFQVFSLLSSAAFVLPLMILPWFIFKKLGASIRGQAKEFALYRGIRARVLQSYFAIGTIVLLVRISISKIELTTFLEGLSSFLFVLLISSTMCTFVYFNYFENELADDIVAGFKDSDSKEGP